jgi:hypothetical protein
MICTANVLLKALLKNHARDRQRGFTELLGGEADAHLLVTPRA